MLGRRWPALVIVLLLVSAGLVGVALVGGDSLGPSAPSTSGPVSYWAFSSGLSAYDAASGYDVWLLSDGTTWTYSHGNWANITSSAGVPIHMVGNSRLAYDARDGYLVLYGGEAFTGAPFPMLHILTDTWIFRAGVWTNLTSSVVGAQPRLSLGGMAYDSEDGVIVLFGGTLTNDTAVQGSYQTWTFSAGAWTNATVPGPPAPFESGIFGAMVDDPADGYLLLYHSLGNAVHPFVTLWTYAGGVWTNRTATFSPAPFLVEFDSFTYDSTSRTIVVVAPCFSTPGFTCVHQIATLEFTRGTWKDVAATPSFRLDASSVDDPFDGGLMVAGGCCWADFSGLSLLWQNVWVYANGTWSESNPWGGGAPSWTGNAGAWAALGMAVAVAVSVAFTPRGKGLPKR